MQRRPGFSIAFFIAAGLGAIADAGFALIGLAIVLGCYFVLREIFARVEAAELPRSRKAFAVFWVPAMASFLLLAAYVHQYGLYTPADLRRLDICIDTDQWGGSADFFGYVAIKCSNRDVIETLSSTELTWAMSGLLPPDRLRYVFEGNAVVGIKIIGSGTEYRLDRKSKCFVQIKGPVQGLVGDCYVRPPYRLQ